MQRSGAVTEAIAAVETTRERVVAREAEAAAELEKMFDGLMAEVGSHFWCRVAVAAHIQSPLTPFNLLAAPRSEEGSV